jgi:dTDP-4-dehydrorhamnose 3,5-epimerase
MTRTDRTRIAGVITTPPIIQAESTGFSGLWLLRPRIAEDARGCFVKTYHKPAFQELGIAFDPKEEFYSTSARNAIRGMHFQSPPAAHAKLVYCLTGRVLDVALDMRKASSTYGLSFTRELSAANREMLFIPVGFAHGFLALADGTSMLYKTDAVHSPACDAGIAWDSFGFAWPVAKPVLSERDRSFPKWAEFQSPF